MREKDKKWVEGHLERLSDVLADLERQYCDLIQRVLRSEEDIRNLQDSVDKIGYDLMPDKEISILTKARDMQATTDRAIAELRCGIKPWLETSDEALAQFLINHPCFNNESFDVEPSYEKWYSYAIKRSGFEKWLNEYLELRSATNYGSLFNHMNKMPKIPEINLDPIEIDSNEDLAKQTSFEYPKLDQKRESELKELLSDAGKQEHRKTALITAINMAMSEDLHIPKEWIEELNELLNK